MCTKTVWRVYRAVIIGRRRRRQPPVSRGSLKADALQKCMCVWARVCVCNACTRRRRLPRRSPWKRCRDAAVCIRFSCAFDRKRFIHARTTLFIIRLPPYPKKNYPRPSLEWYVCLLSERIMRDREREKTDEGAWGDVGRFCRSRRFICPKAHAQYYYNNNDDMTVLYCLGITACWISLDVIVYDGMFWFQKSRRAPENKTSPAILS